MSHESCSLIVYRPRVLWPQKNKLIIINLADAPKHEVNETKPVHSVQLNSFNSAFFGWDRDINRLTM